MNPADPRWLSQLAGEYVLGTLRGRARRRVERALESDAKVRAAVEAWQTRLAPLTAGIEPVAPAPATWLAVVRRLALEPTARRTRRRWAGPPLALAAMLALAAITVTVRVWQDAHAFRPAAVVAGAQGERLWQVELNAAGDRLRITVVGPVVAPSGRDLELWALPEGGAPVSLGLLPVSGHLSRPLGATQRRALSAARKVAVSVEPAGGSTTGAPTGPVIHVAPLTLAAASAGAPAPAS